MPIATRAWLVSNFNVGWYKRIPDKAAARREVESVALLTSRQVEKLFPEAQIYREVILGMTKSFVAYHGWS